MTIRPATIADLDRLVPLFDAYRQFYGQPSDMDGARAFLTERFDHGDSVMLIAGDGTGFAQLYPLFSSVRMRRTLVLNDLFVVPDARGRGTGHALLEAACAHARRSGAARLSLSTAVDNSAAHALYQRAGWVRDAQFHTFTFALDGAA